MTEQEYQEEIGRLRHIIHRNGEAFRKLRVTAAEFRDRAIRAEAALKEARRRKGGSELDDVLGKLFG